MRLAFVNALIKSAKKIDNLQLLTGDLGFEVFEEYIAKFPGRFTNMGVSEANIVGVAAGMAHSGLEVICYSIAPFLVFRAFEQIRNDVCYHNLNVKIVGVGGGLSYSWNGQSHTQVEDIAVMRSLPNMTVLCPGDPLETYKCTTEMFKIPGPVYLRLGKKGEPIVSYDYFDKFSLNKISRVSEGKDLAIFSTGNMLETTCQVVEKLEKSGIRPSHLQVHTIKPLDREGITQILKTHSKIVTIEEHSIIGGLGSAISELNLPNPHLTIGINDKYFNIGGTQTYLRKLAGLDPETITKRIQEWLN